MSFKPGDLVEFRHREDPDCEDNGILGLVLSKPYPAPGRPHLTPEIIVDIQWVDGADSPWEYVQQLVMVCPV